VTGWPLEVETGSVEETKSVAGRLAGLVRTGDMVLLVGDLGAGKTAFAQGFAAALGVPGPVTSPTFALVRQYRCGPGAPVGTLLHADVFRTGSVAEVVDLALAELVEEDAAAIVEWGDVAAPALAESVLEVMLSVPAGDELTAANASPAGDASGPDRRLVTLRGRGAWARRASEVAEALASPEGATATATAPSRAVR
jgi:tRNA threonylcarbamoyladenosine biosynthesis protein TsaE